MTARVQGAGQFAPNRSPGGFDPVLAPSSPLRLPPLASPPRFDIGTRSFVRSDDGTMEQIHWVDQAVALAMGVPIGGIQSLATLGNTTRRIKRAGGPRFQADVTDAVQTALAALLERRDIVVVELSISTPVASHILVVLTYVNLRLTPQVPRNLSSVF